MNKKHFWIVIIIWGIFSGNLFGQIKPPYKNPRLSSKERTLNLLSLMTLDEKIGQLRCLLGWEMYKKTGNKISHSSKFEELIKTQHIGMFWAVYRADPWTKKTLINGLNPYSAAGTGNAIQRYAMEKTRLGIPIFMAEEAPHGHMAIGATVFPTGIGQASTWNTDLLQEMGAVISKEIRVQGGHISYGPVIDISRDPRWSRVEESFGEDYVLSAQLATAIVKGNGGGRLQEPNSTITTLKHFIAYGIPEGGHNGNSAIVGKRELQEVFLPPFEDAIDAGALSVMTAYNSIDGVPCTSNKELLTDILHYDWNFKGFTISDLISIDGLMGNHHVAGSLEDAAALAINAGVDVDLGGNAFAELEKAVKNKKVNIATIDTAVYRVLKLKFDMGLFENPYVDPVLAKEVVRNPGHIALARRVAQESVVLLKNKNGILPLNKNLKLAIIGPNADNPYNQLGDYTAPQERSDIKTVLDGIKSKLSDSQIEYVKGCSIRDTLHAEIGKAVEAAKRSDIAVVVVGGSSARDFKTDYLETGAAIASTQTLSDMESGEGFDRATLDLLGKQLDLLKAVKATGKPVVVIYIQGRPLNMNWADEHADALLTAWYPGQEGGSAIADILFGDYNPAGRLPISIPRHEGQIPVYYNKKNPRGHNYVEMSADPLYSFGYGLSYTRFEYKDIKTVQKDKYSFEVSFTLKNTGSLSGDEVAQLYLRDEVASVVQPVKQLKRFKRVHLAPNEEKIVSFTLTADDLSIINDKFERVVESGLFTIMIGASSTDIKLTIQIEVE
ncbi:MAG: glycoside hydrolase family 3 C-terminal domain-containing protein [Prevotella sp.]|nr:glycoside hydrolase family 3 C-terminal domain-containing protein [Prevotella sp.]